MKNKFSPVLSLIVSFLTFAVYAAVPLRFCKYLESQSNGSVATYVDSGLKPHGINGKFFIDFQLTDEALPSKVSYLFGYRNSTAINNHIFSVALDETGKFRLDTLYVDNSKYTVGSSATAGHRYRMTVRKRYNYSGERCDIEDVTAGGTRTRYGSSGSKYNGAIGGSFCFFSAKVGSSVSSATVSQRLYSAKIWNDGSTMNGDYIPCVDSSGKYGLYNVVDGSIKLANPQANFTVSEEDSPFARVKDGAVEFCTRVVAEDGVQVSSDDGETWSSQVEVWSKSGDSSFTVKARSNPDIPYAVFTGWNFASAHKLDFSGVSGQTTATLTCTAGKVRDIIATGNVGGFAPQAEMLPNGNFEALNYVWTGGGDRKSDFSYVKTKDPVLGSYIWCVLNGTGNLTNPDLSLFNLSLPPAAYKFSYGAAISGNTVENIAQIRTPSGGTVITAFTNKITTSYATMSKDLTFTTARGAVIYISRKANSSNKHALDNVSLKMKLPICGLVVTGEPEEFKSAADFPVYGWFPMEDGRMDTFAAPGETVYLNSDETTRGFVRGYRIDTYDEAASSWILGEEVASSSYQHTQSGTECKRLVWLWTADNKISVVSQNATQLVSSNGVDWVQSYSEWYPYESAPAVYAGTSTDILYAWTGVPAGTTFGIRNAIINVPMSAPRSLVLGGLDFPVSHIWAGPSKSFTEPSAWLTPLGEVASAAPGAQDSVYIPPASTCTVSRAFSVANLYVGDAFGLGLPGAVSMSFSSGLETNEIAGTLIVGKGATLTHSANGAALSQRLNLKALGSITITKGASIDVKAKGYNNSKGPAPGANNTNGGSHAGVGANNSGVNTYKCYGSIRKPDMPGSGGGSKGGGVVYLSTPGMLQMDGTINATGENITYYRSGAGGSVFLEAGTLTGTGSVDVRGGSGTYNYQGGSGRISVVESVATEFTFAGTLNAGAINVRSGTGTLYRENASHEHGRGELIVDARDISVASDCYCRLDSAVTDATEPFGKVSVKRGARLLVPSGMTLKIINGLDTVGGYLSTGTSGGAIEFMPGENGVCDISGAVRAFSFFCTNSPNATLKFASGAVLTNYVNGVSAFSTPSGTLGMVGAAEDSKWAFDIASGVTITATDIKISNCNATGVSIGIINGNDLGGNVNCNFTKPIEPGDPIVWTGDEDMNWSNGNNWNPKRVPVETDVITIPAGCLNYPVISGNDMLLNSLFTEAGAKLTLSGIDLTVTNLLSSAGEIVYGGQEKLILAGDGQQEVNFFDTEIVRLILDKQSGDVTFASGFKVRELFKCNAVSPLSLYFAPGKTYDIGEFFVDGMTLDGEGGVNSLIEMAPLSSGTWKLKVTQSQRVRGVTVSRCDATLGENVYAGIFATDAGGNSGWDFSASCAADWIGSSNTSFENAANWLPAEVPGENTSVTICAKSGATRTVAVSSNTSVKNLILGGDDGNVNFSSTALAKLSVGGRFEVRAKVVATINHFAMPNEVADDIIVRRNGKITHANNNSKLYLSAGRDIFVAAGGMICADGVSTATTGLRGDAWAHAASYGGIGHGGYADTCYGSIFEPFDNGSKGQNYSGGGAVRLVAGRRLHIDGRVTAYGNTEASGGGGSGGSVWLTAGVISGKGVIASSSVTDYTNGTLAYNYSGGGGRIALYQTEAQDWSELKITPSVNSATTDNNAKGNCGTVYWQLPSDEPHGGRIVIPGQYAIAMGTGFPVSGDGDVRSAYKKATLEIGPKACIFVTNSVLTSLGGVVRIRDIDIKGTAAKVLLYENTIKVGSLNHRNGRGWTSGRNYAESVSSGAIDTSLGGRILWLSGLRINVR